MTLNKALELAYELIDLRPSCKACGETESCLGCPFMLAYRRKYNEYAHIIGEEQLKMVISYIDQTCEVELKGAEYRKAKAALNNTARHIKRMFMT